MKRLRYQLCLSMLLFISGIRAQDLQSYIREAEANNPMIQASELRYSIAKEKINEVNTLPNTSFGVGYFASEPETRTGAQRARFSVNQMLPWFGTITARENYASSMAEAEYMEIAIAKRDLALSVARSYYELYAIRAKQKVLDANIRLLATYEELALRSVEVAQASAVDVLRLQIRQNELRQQKRILQEADRAEQAQFNYLRNQKETLAVEVVDELALPEEDPVQSFGRLELNPVLLKYDRLFESVMQSEALNQKESAPDLGIGLDYVPVSERKDLQIPDTGKDVIMPMVSVSIPIFNNRYKSVSLQNALRKEEIQYQRQDRLNTLKSALARAKSARDQARISYDIQGKNLNQAKDAETILSKSYETGTIDFRDILDLQELQLKIQLERIEATKNYYTQSSIINYLIQ
ncbi:Outer membrane protein TolC [Muriicola jejuensis]|uniref:TolC family protein n=1 Tax=Muriicola jejuensis TaxID=504488 RepID=A0A6P0UGE7_9FLAO|nr:TolC family protein [Muriicola jejuensis]NER10868.1 TolC family protein [Muriicola jejuensis]SMP15903.1 Outer membrane protein TolC [Muriicola jejuensis]